LDARQVRLHNVPVAKVQGGHRFCGRGWLRGTEMGVDLMLKIS
jgi:hypothetical protein